MQELDDALEYSPAKQFEQTGDPAPLNDPEEHGAQVSDTAVDAVPAEHGVQPKLESRLNDPALHSAQTRRPIVDVYFPPVQSTHSLVSSGQCFPTAQKHAMQPAFSFDVAPIAVPKGVPGSQLVQLAVPVEAA